MSDGRLSPGPSWATLFGILCAALVSAGCTAECPTCECSDAGPIDASVVPAETPFSDPAYSGLVISEICAFGVRTGEGQSADQSSSDVPRMYIEVYNPSDRPLPLAAYQARFVKVHLEAGMNPRTSAVTLESSGEIGPRGYYAFIAKAMQLPGLGDTFTSWSVIGPDGAQLGSGELNPRPTARCLALNSAGSMVPTDLPTPGTANRIQLYVPGSIPAGGGRDAIYSSLVLHSAGPGSIWFTNLGLGQFESVRFAVGQQPVSQIEVLAEIDDLTSGRSSSRVVQLAPALGLYVLPGDMLTQRPDPFVPRWEAPASARVRVFTNDSNRRLIGEVEWCRGARLTRYPNIDGPFVTTGVDFQTGQALYSADAMPASACVAPPDLPIDPVITPTIEPDAREVRFSELCGRAFLPGDSLFDSTHPPDELSGNALGFLELRNPSSTPRPVADYRVRFVRGVTSVVVNPVGFGAMMVPGGVYGMFLPLPDPTEETYPLGYVPAEGDRIQLLAADNTVLDQIEYRPAGARCMSVVTSTGTLRQNDFPTPGYANRLVRSDGNATLESAPPMFRINYVGRSVALAYTSMFQTPGVMLGLEFRDADSSRVWRCMRGPVEEAQPGDLLSLGRLYGGLYDPGLNDIGSTACEVSDARNPIPTNGSLTLYQLSALDFLPAPDPTTGLFPPFPTDARVDEVSWCGLGDIVANSMSQSAVMRIPSVVGPFVHGEAEESVEAGEQPTYPTAIMLAGGLRPATVCSSDFDAGVVADAATIVPDGGRDGGVDTGASDSGSAFDSGVASDSGAASDGGPSDAGFTALTCSPSMATSMQVGDSQRARVKVTVNFFGNVLGCAVASGSGPPPVPEREIAVFYADPNATTISAYGGSAATSGQTVQFESASAGMVLANGSLIGVPFGAATDIVMLNQGTGARYRYRITITGNAAAFAIEVATLTPEDP